MYISTLPLAALLLAADIPNVTAKAFLDIHHHQHAAANLVQAVRRDAHEIMNSYHRRDAVPEPASASASSTAAAVSGNPQNFDTPAWNATTTSSCTTALASLQGNVTNPAGMAVCYNIPFLDNTTGVFEADLRLYQAAPPSGAFTGVQPGAVSVGMSYLHATISASQASKAKRDMVETTLESRQTTANNNMTMLQAFQFVGQIDKALTITSLNSSALQALLSPVITLSASSPMTNQPVTTNLSASDTAYFTNGVFAGKATTGTAAAAEANPAAAAAAASQAAVFVVPGVSFGIFPIGFIVTGAWTVLFFLAVGWGTVGRMRFRDHYRRRLQRANTTGGR